MMFNFEPHPHGCPKTTTRDLLHKVITLAIACAEDANSVIGVQIGLEALEADCVYSTVDVS